jgi:hypothetical protein
LLRIPPLLAVDQKVESWNYKLRLKYAAKLSNIEGRKGE